MKDEATGTLVRAAAESLRAHPPFCSMAEGALEWIGLRSRLAYFRRGEEIKQDVSTLENPQILEQLKQST